LSVTFFAIFSFFRAKTERKVTNIDGELHDTCHSKSAFLHLQMLKKTPKTVNFRALHKITSFEQ
jgi:hypothetical protein